MNWRISIIKLHVYVESSQLYATCNDKGNEIAYLQNQIQALEGYLYRLKNHDQQQEEIQN